MKFMPISFLSALLLLPSMIFCAEVWKSVEEVEVNGQIVTKNIYVTEDTMKTENISDAGRNESLVDLKADKITFINHKTQSFQVVKLSKYIEFAQQLASDIRAQGHIDSDKVIPQVTFEKKGNVKIGDFDCEEWNVNVDGKQYSKVFVAPSMKDSPVIKFKKKFAAMMPDSLVKFRSIEAKIEDNFLSTGMIIKAVRTPISKKVPVVTQTIKLVQPVALESVSLKVPANYVDKSAPENNEQNTQTK